MLHKGSPEGSHINIDWLFVTNLLFYKYAHLHLSLLLNI